MEGRGRGHRGGSGQPEGRGRGGRGNFRGRSDGSQGPSSRDSRESSQSSRSHGGRGFSQGPGGYRPRGSSHSSNRGGGGGRPADNAAVFGSGPVPRPDPNITQWETKLVSDVASGMQGLSIAGNKCLPLRPGYGTQGTPIIVRTNFFPLDILNKNLTLYRYEVTILPKAGGANEEDEATKKMAKARRRQFISLLMQSQIFRHVRCATDYAKVIVTDQRLNMPEGNFTDVAVAYHDPDETPLAQTPAASESDSIKSRRVNRTRKLRIYEAGELSNLSVSDLLDAIASGRQSAYYHGKEEMIQALNIILNDAVLRTPQTHRVALIGQNKFFPFQVGALRESRELGEGLTALRGYFSSLRIGANRLLLNVNVASGAFYKSVPLPELVRDFTNKAPTSSAPVLNRLNIFLKGLKVRTNYAKESGSPLIQVRKIVGIARKPKQETRGPSKGKGDARMTTDDRGNSREMMNKWDNNGKLEFLTVQQYFKKLHNKNIQDLDEFVVNCGTLQNPFWIPLELCEVLAGQPVQRLLSSTQTSEMIKFAARAPSENAISITGNGLKLLKVTDQNAQSNTHGTWEIKIHNQMITVNARVLQPPTIAYQNSTTRPRNGMWNFGSIKFIKGSKVPSWSVLHVRNHHDDNPLSDNDIERLAATFQTQANSYGILMPKRSQISQVIVPGNQLHHRDVVDGKLRDAFHHMAQSSNKPSLVWVIIPQKDVFLKARIKLHCDVSYGMQTMLIQKEVVKKGLPDVWANEAAKLNLRYGGTCWRIDPSVWKPLDNTYMLLGIDVSHPSPGSSEDAPSIAAVVATIDGNFAQYRGRVKPQESKVEMVSGLGELLVELLTLWRNNNSGHLPKNILVYRDGVSEGQYQAVLDTEVPALETAFEKMYGGADKWPNLSVVVVTKRHHVRFFPTDSKDTCGRMLNCIPGTVVDRGITGGGSQLWDTYLQAHQGIQGHARSARYVFLRHGIKVIKVDDFERITNALCYMWQRAPRSVSYAPPAYYADLLAERGRAYLIRYLNDPENKERYKAGSSDWNGDVHPAVKDTMFFC